MSEVVQLLDDADMEAIVRDFGDRNPDEDPVIHFYEHFLAAYDKKQKVNRGVFYTPRPVVSFIVRSVDETLRTDFGLVDGLADTTTWSEMAERHPGLELPSVVSPHDPFVQILDPATGTGTFLVEVIDTVFRTMDEKWRSEGRSTRERTELWNEYVPDSLLPRLNGFELLMAPYAIAHLKVGLKLHETGYRFESDERARVYLTNTLEPAADYSGRLAFAIPALAHEAAAVNDIKRHTAFSVVVGNPPYANRGQLNRNEWILGLLDDYKKGLGEKKINLDDDFIKFIRWAHHHVVRTGVGIIGLISSNTYLHGVTHRRMRQALLRDFQSVRLLDLHGNSQLGEVAPDGSSDSNVFDIRQGVAIAVFTRTMPTTGAMVRTYGELWGSRAAKYSLLADHTRLDISATELDPGPEDYFLAPMSLGLRDEFNRFEAVNTLFVVGNNGFKTDRDDLFLDFDEARLAARMEYLYGLDWSPEFIREFRVVPSSSYAIKRKVSGSTLDLANIRTCQYRPFDYRFVYYSTSITSRPAYDAMQHMAAGNLGLITSRLMARAGGFDSCMVSRHITETKCGDSTRSSYLFPLYRREAESSSDMPLLEDEWESNLATAAVSAVAQSTGLSFRRSGRGDLVAGFGPEDLFAYLYAVLHSPEYRQRYRDLLRIGFPRIPLDPGAELFGALAGIGQRLIALHLLDDEASDLDSGTYLGPPEPRVSRVQWTGGTVLLDTETARFDHVPEAVWQFRIGGYQVCEKWLKDRRGRTLSPDDIAHYQKIVGAISETIGLMDEIDEVIEAHGGWPGAFMTSGRDS